MKISRAVLRISVLWVYGVMYHYGGGKHQASDKVVGQGAIPFKIPAQ